MFGNTPVKTKKNFDTKYFVINSFYMLFTEPMRLFC